MFKNLFGGGAGDKGTAQHAEGGKKGVARPPEKDAHALLAAAQASLQKLRGLPSDHAEAFPVLNEASRYGGCRWRWSWLSRRPWLTCTHPASCNRHNRHSTTAGGRDCAAAGHGRAPALAPVSGSGVPFLRSDVLSRCVR
jgi:hypothetical protein